MFQGWFFIHCTAQDPKRGDERTRVAQLGFRHGGCSELGLCRRGCGVVGGVRFERRRSGWVGEPIVVHDVRESGHHLNVNDIDDYDVDDSADHEGAGCR